MAKNEDNLSRWVDDRLSSLDAPGTWHPDAARGLSRLRQRDRTARRRRIEWVFASAAGLAACAAILVLTSPGACARERGCANDPIRPAAPNVVSRPAAAPPRVPQVAVHFKESGLPTAPILCEIYTDYECPSCAALYRDIVPLLVQQYVQTGKVRLLHRDFPLPQHPYARQAARLANAAGIIGQYDVVVNQIFRTQALWNLDGNVDSQVALVLTPQAMERVRTIVGNDAHLDDTVNADLSMGVRDQIRQTPTLVIVSGGKRQILAGVPPFSMLQEYLDVLLAR